MAGTGKGSASANWSVPSVTDNDENVLVIRGDKRVADIYFGEFMRLFAHHRSIPRVGEAPPR